VNEILAKSPLLMIRGRGTGQTTPNFYTNPTFYRIILTTMVLAYDANSSPVWTSALAEDKLDDLDRLVRQIIRNNTQNAAWNVLEFEESPSIVEDVIVGKGVPYIVESRAVLARLSSGAI
jgi:hypothetical protein